MNEESMEVLTSACCEATVSNLSAAVTLGGQLVKISGKVTNLPKCGTVSVAVKLKATEGTAEECYLYFYQLPSFTSCASEAMFSFDVVYTGTICNPTFTAQILHATAACPTSC